MSETADPNEAEPDSALPVERAKTGSRRPANALGVTFIAEDFDGPLPDDMQNAFEGKG